MPDAFTTLSATHDDSARSQYLGRSHAGYFTPISALLVPLIIVMMTMAVRPFYFFRIP